MYVRPPNSNRTEFKLPENYSGNAFNRFSTYADMPPPTKTPINRSASKAQNMINTIFCFLVTCAPPFGVGFIDQLKKSSTDFFRLLTRHAHVAY